MRPRYYYEILDETSPDYWFAYFDTEDNLAMFLFDYYHVDVTIENVFGNEDEKYRIILCRIPRNQREAFLKAVALIPGLMDYTGHTDYEDFCRNVMADIRRRRMKKDVQRITPLQ